MPLASDDDTAVTGRDRIPGLAGRSAGIGMLERGAASAIQRELGRPISARLMLIQGE